MPTTITEGPLKGCKFYERGERFDPERDLPLRDFGPCNWCGKPVVMKYPFWVTWNDAEMTTGPPSYKSQPLHDECCKAGEYETIFNSKRSSDRPLIIPASMAETFEWDGTVDFVGYYNVRPQACACGSSERRKVTLLTSSVVECAGCGKRLD